MKSSKLAWTLLAAAALGLAACGRSEKSSTEPERPSSSKTPSSATPSSASSVPTPSSSSSAPSSEEPADPRDYTDDSWTPAGDEKGYYYDEEGNIYCNVTEEIGEGGSHFVYEHTNYNLYNEEQGANYKVSVHYEGSYKGETENENYAGVIAWWKDADNYIAFITQWANWDRPSEIRSLVVTGKIGGKNYSADNWCDNCGIASADGIDLTVEKTGTSFAWDLNGDGHDVKNGTVTIEGTDSETAKVGILGANDTFKFSGFSVEAVVPETVFTYKNTVSESESYTLTIDTAALTYTLTHSVSGADDVVTNGTYAADGRNLTLTPSDGSATLYVKLDKAASTFAFYTPTTITGTEVDGTAERAYLNVEENTTRANFVEEFDFAGTYTSEGHAVKVGFQPYYVDDNNYLEIYVEWSATDRSHEIRCVQLTGYIGGTHLGWNDKWCDGSNKLDSDGFHMVVTIAYAEGTGTTMGFTLTSGDWSKSDSSTFASVNMTTAHTSRLYAEGDKITFSNMDCYTDLKDQYDVAGDAASSAVLHDNKMLLPAGVSAIQKDTRTADYTFSAKLTGTVNDTPTANIRAGFYAWYVDADNYIEVYVEWSESDRAGQIREVQITGKNAGTQLAWNDVWCDGVSVLPADSVTLTVQKTAKTFNVTLVAGEATKTGSATFDAVNTDTAYKLGLYATNDAFTFTNVSLA